MKCYTAHARCQSRRCRAFTLVELLVVIAIIGLLVGLLVPAIQSTRQGARRTKCWNNMRQIGIAVQQFVDIHNGRFPFTEHAGTNASGSWVFTLAPFLESVDEIRICPDDLTGEGRIPLNGTSYVINEYVSLPSTPGAILSINKLAATSRTFIVFEGSQKRPLDITYDHVHPSQWYDQFNINNNIVWDVLCTEIQPDEHTNTTANYLFADGHVEEIPAQTVHEWVDVDILQGTNFALPITP